MRARATVASVVVLALGSGAARAQIPAPAPGATAGGAGTSAGRISMNDAVREAIEHNLTLVAERYSVNVAQARILTAKLRPNPVLTYNAMLPDSKIHDENVNPLEHVVRGDFVVEGGGKRRRRIDVAEQGKSVAELQFLNTMRGVVLDVESAFLDVLLATENLALAREVSSNTTRSRRRRC